MSDDEISQREIGLHSPGIEHEYHEDLKFRNAVFTAYKEPQDVSEDDRVVYYVCGEEICPTTGRKHWQGFIQLGNAYRRMAIQSILGVKCYVARMFSRGTPEACRRYCIKAGGIVHEWGTLRSSAPRSAHPSDSRPASKDDMVCKIRQGENLRWLVENMCTNGSSIKLAECLFKWYEPERDWKPEIWWICGETDSQKSRYAKEEFPGAYWCMHGYKYWEGYDAHDVVVIDEFRRDWCPFDYLLKLTDRYPMRVDCKYGSRQLRFTTLVITSPDRPEVCFSNNGFGATGISSDIRQLLRRIEHVVVKTKKVAIEVVGGVEEA